MAKTLPQGITANPEDSVNSDGTVNYGAARYYQVEDQRAARPRAVTGSLGYVMRAHLDDEGNLTGFNRENKFYIPLSTRRGVSDPHEIDRMEDMMAVDQVYFREYGEYADTREPGILEKLARPRREYNAFREDLKSRIEKTDMSVPVWLKRSCPEIDILRYLEPYRNRKDLRAEIARGFLGNQEFVDELTADEDSAKIHEYLTGLVESKDQEDLEARRKKPEPESEEKSRGAGQEPEPPLDPVVKESARVGDKDMDQKESADDTRLDRLENQMAELTGLLKNITTPGQAGNPAPESRPEQPAQPPPDVAEFGQTSPEVFEGNGEGPEVKTEYKGPADTTVPPPGSSRKGSTLQLGRETISFSTEELDPRQYRPESRSVMISLTETRDADCFQAFPDGCAMVAGAARLAVEDNDPVNVTEISGPVRIGGRVVRSIVI